MVRKLPEGKVMRPPRMIGELLLLLLHHPALRAENREPEGPGGRQVEVHRGAETSRVGVYRNRLIVR